MDETKIEEAITPRTKAIVAVHYAGVGCDMDSIKAVAEAHNLIVIEDAAQGIMATYKHKPLGGIGHLGVYSFHETKNAISGEGGALLINDSQYAKRAEIIWEKGTNRSQFFRGEVDKYTWVDIGSSCLPSEVIAAFLWAQLEEVEIITQRRLAIWQQYHVAFVELEKKGKIRRPIIPAECQHNAHMYYLLFPNLAKRTQMIEQLKNHNINAVFHYIPLHSSPAGHKYGRSHGQLPLTNNLSERLLRLPLWVGMTEQDVNKVIQVIHQSI
jgi:dTDP-4-amino-4,6-dideoxygalactose transaminase